MPTCCAFQYTHGKVVLVREAMQHAEDQLPLDSMHTSLKPDGQDTDLWWLATKTSQCCNS